MNIPASALSLFIFDLDGTLIDSQADIASAINLGLAKMNLQSLSIPRVADFIGDGMQKLVERALLETTGREPGSAETQRLITLFGEEYERHLLDQTRLYPHVREALMALSSAKLAVVSNKPERFSRRILEGLGIAPMFRIILGGDSTHTRKPDPTGILKAIEICETSPSKSMMVGDSPVDIAAGKAAGTFTCGVLGGFRHKEQLEASGCDLLVNNLLELANIITNNE
jgi:phosphoglycolate phosphatase